MFSLDLQKYKFLLQKTPWWIQGKTLFISFGFHKKGQFLKLPKWDDGLHWLDRKVFGCWISESNYYEVVQRQIGGNRQGIGVQAWLKYCFKGWPVWCEQFRGNGNFVALQSTPGTPMSKRQQPFYTSNRWPTSFPSGYTKIKSRNVYSSKYQLLIVSID